MFADLHCDLLSYLVTDTKRTPYEFAVRCSIPQLQAGSVGFQVLAIYVNTLPGSSLLGRAQIAILEDLAQKYPAFQTIESTDPRRVIIMGAIENASALWEEQEPFEEGLKRLKITLERLGHLFYISLTWNEENRFGGGASVDIGLKADGQKLLDFLDKKGIAVDLSHTSDRLAHDIFNYIDRHTLQIPVIASHSNFRAICDMPRNLPDDLAREIFKRQGLVGLNFYSKFIGFHKPKQLIQHIEHGLKLGGESSLCFGADYFCFEDFPDLEKHDHPPFFPEYPDSSKYPYVMHMLEESGKFSKDFLNQLQWNNVSNFLNRHYQSWSAIHLTDSALLNKNKFL